jgi:hypothetical protein
LSYNYFLEFSRFRLCFRLFAERKSIIPDNPNASKQPQLNFAAVGLLGKNCTDILLLLGMLVLVCTMKLYIGLE